MLPAVLTSKRFPVLAMGYGSAVLALVLAACSSSSGGGSSGGAVSSSGGTMGTGGGLGSGGAAGSGGGTSSGGASATGGAPGTGGIPSGSGGASQTGGAPATGGTPGGGGSSATGGVPGGAGASANGGAGTGGSAGRGGAPGSGGATAAVTIPRGGRCMPPAAAKLADAQAAYAKWKQDLLTTDGAGTNGIRVRRPNTSGAVVNSTVSEGIAYGMLIAVYMNDEDTFDKLWNYSQQFLDGNGLMNWYIGPDRSVLGSGGATDADEDMAFALLIADKRWGGRGTLSQTYLSLAMKQIGLIWQFEVDHTRNDVPTPGDQGGGGGSVINISYFAPAFYRAFGRATNQQANWDRVITTSYNVLGVTLNATNKNAVNGLVPAWSTPAGVPMGRPGTGDPTHHQLDSCRTPFRLAQDYCWYNEPNALAYLKKISAFYQMIGATNILDGYNLDGTAHAQFASVGSQSAAFVGPAGVGAMASPDFAMLRDQAYADVATLSLFAGSQYYNESWTVLSLLMMTGMMDDLTLP